MVDAMKYAAAYQSGGQEAVEAQIKAEAEQAAKDKADDLLVDAIGTDAAGVVDKIDKAAETAQSAMGAFAACNATVVPALTAAGAPIAGIGAPAGAIAGEIGCGLYAAYIVIQEYWSDIKGFFNGDLWKSAGDKAKPAYVDGPTILAVFSGLKALSDPSVYTKLPQDVIDHAGAAMHRFKAVATNLGRHGRGSSLDYQMSVPQAKALDEALPKIWVLATGIQPKKPRDFDNFRTNKKLSQPYLRKHPENWGPLLDACAPILPVFMDYPQDVKKWASHHWSKCNDAYRNTFEAIQNQGLMQTITPRVLFAQKEDITKAPLNKPYKTASGKSAINTYSGAPIPPILNNDMAWTWMFYVETPIGRLEHYELTKRNFEAVPKIFDTIGIYNKDGSITNSQYQRYTPAWFKAKSKAAQQAYRIAHPKVKVLNFASKKLQVPITYWGTGALVSTAIILAALRARGK